jgi:TM2 domain-containing membrane protein YozV
MFCPNCGTRVVPGALNCATCGSRLNPEEQQALMPPPPPPPYSPAAVGYVPMQVGLSQKSKIAAGLLQIFLGAFGAGRFYTGHTSIAIAQIAVSWLTCGFGVLWPFIDGILMLSGKVTDSDGRPLRD